MKKTIKKTAKKPATKAGRVTLSEVNAWAMGEPRTVRKGKSGRNAMY